MKYIVNTNLENIICSSLSKSVDAQLFWLAFFKSQLNSAADEFFEAVRQISELNGLPGYYSKKFKEFDLIMEENEYVIDV